MIDLNQENHTSPRPFSPISLFRAWIHRWGAPGKGGSNPIPAQFSASPVISRRYLKVDHPALREVSPAKVNPFPEPNTMPGGWDVSELTKS